MQSIIDKLQTPQSFVQSVQELVIALQRTGDPGHLTALRHGLLYCLNFTLMIHQFFINTDFYDLTTPVWAFTINTYRVLQLQADIL